MIEFRSGQIVLAHGDVYMAEGMQARIKGEGSLTEDGRFVIAPSESINLVYTFRSGGWKKEEQGSCACEVKKEKTKVKVGERSSAYAALRPPSKRQFPFRPLQRRGGYLYYEQHALKRLLHRGNQLHESPLL